MKPIPENCPHCQQPLSKWQVPEETSWEEEFFYICFNDECPYFVQGWKWMKEQYSQRASFRYMISPITGASSSLPVWSNSAMREMIVANTKGGNE